MVAGRFIARVIGGHPRGRGLNSARSVDDGGLARPGACPDAVELQGPIEPVHKECTMMSDGDRVAGASAEGDIGAVATVRV